MNNDNQSTHSTDEDEKTILKRGTESSSSSFKKSEFTLARGKVVNEWDASVESEDVAKCQEITPCAAAQLTSVPRKEFSVSQGKSSAVGPSIADIHDDELCNPEDSSVCQSNGESDSDDQIRPKGPCSGVETEWNGRPRYSRAISGIFSTNGIESYPISHADRRLQLRRRSTGSFRDALETGESGDGGKDCADGGISALSIKTDHKKGKCPRESINASLLRHDSSFDFNPDQDHYPVRRNSTGNTLVVSEDDESLVRKIKACIRRDSTVFTLKCENEQIMVQHPAQTGRIPFGCRLHSCQSGDDQWFHLLKLDNTPNSLTRQLGIRDHDEVLILKDDPLICIDHKQVLIKFLHSLNDRKIQLVVRRMISNAGGGFEYIEIKAQIKADDTIIPKIERVDVSDLVKRVGKFEKRSTRNIRIFFRPLSVKQYVKVQNSSTLSVTSTEADSDIFVQDIYIFYLMWDWKNTEYLCTLRHEESNKYITADSVDETLKLTAQEGLQVNSPFTDTEKTKYDARLFRRRDDKNIMFLEHKANTGSYLACTDSGLSLLEADKPKHIGDWIYCQMIDV